MMEILDSLNVPDEVKENFRRENVRTILLLNYDLDYHAWDLLDQVANRS